MTLSKFSIVDILGMNNSQLGEFLENSTKDETLELISNIIRHNQELLTENISLRHAAANAIDGLSEMLGRCQPRKGIDAETGKAVKPSQPTKPELPPFIQRRQRFAQSGQRPYQAGSSVRLPAILEGDR